MQMNITARQISQSRPLPVISRFLRPGDRLQVSTSFAEGIIARYKASEEQDLPSVSFVYPETAALTTETLDRLAAQMITLNRIRVRMNIHNHHWIHNYALSLENSCKVLLNQLAVRAQASPGTVSSVSVRELERILKETSRDIAGSIAADNIERNGADRSATGIAGSAVRNTADNAAENAAGRAENAETAKDSDLQPEEETILRILTAASRGNGMRERYMAALYRRLQESAGPEWSGESSALILQRAGKELFHIGSGNAGINSWASEEARQFFWRVQRAPEQERELILKAGGYPTILSLEQELKKLDRASFRRFSEALSEEIIYLQEPAGRSWEADVSAEKLVEQMSDEDWVQFTDELKQSGYIFREGSLVALDQETPEHRAAELLLSEEPYIRPEDFSDWASVQARELFWRIQRAPAQERQMFLEAGGFAGMESLENLLRTMDDVTFRRFSAQLLERLTHFTSEPADKLSGERTAPETGAQHLQSVLALLSANEDAGEVSPEETAALSDLTAGTELVYRAETGERISEERTSGERISGDRISGEQISGEQLSEGDVPQARRVSEEKQVFVKTADGRQESSEMLMRLLLAHTERTEIRNENRRAGEAISQVILNLTMDEWAQFREELRSADIIERFPGSFDSVFGETAELTYASSGTAAADHPEQTLTQQKLPEQGTAEQVLLEQGMRMSREKREMIRTIYELSQVPDHSFRDLTRTLHDRTILREYSIRENSRQYFRGLTARERENWAGFVRELLEESQPGTLSPGEIYLRMNSTNTGAADILRMTGAGGDTEESRREAAGGILEHLRESRIAAAENNRSEYMDTPELIPADMDVPQRQAAAAQLAAAATAATPAVRENRTEYHDIEFETVTRRTEEHTVREQSRDMKELAARLEKQEREIGRLQAVQERILERNIPGEVFRKLEDRAQMERLRGGR